MRKPEPIHHTTVTKDWDGNELVTDRGNRIYVSHGRWQWTAECKTCGWVSRPHDTKRDATHDADGHAIALARMS